MYPLKNSTALTIPFFAHNASGDAVTGLIDAGFTKQISKNGGAFVAMTVTITEMENGFYSIPLSAAHANTDGILTILFTHGSAKQINLQFRVHARLPDDLALSTEISALNNVAATDIVSGGVITTAGGAVSTVTNLTNLPSIPANWITAAGIAALALNGKGDWNIGKTGYTLTAAEQDVVVDKVWNELQSGHVTAGTFGLFLDAVLSGIATPAQVNAEVDNALNTAIPGGPTGDSINQRMAAIDDLIQAMGAGDLAAIKTKTDSLTFTKVNEVDSNMVSVSGSTESAQDLGASAKTIVKGAAVAGTLSLTQMTTDLTQATNDHYIGRVIIWTGGALQDQATNITDYAGANGLLTFTPVTDIPAVGNTFIII